MKTKKNASLRVAAFATLAISFGLRAFTNASATGNINKAKKMTTFVGGDIHTLTFTKSGLFVTGHEAGSLSTNAGMRWKSIPSFKNADIMGWATTDLGYLAGGHNGLFRSSDGGKTFTRFNFYDKVSDVHSLGAASKYVYMGSPQAGFLRSIDGGKTWAIVNQKIGQGFMGSMLVDPSNPLRVIAPDMTNGLVVTNDGGKTWAHFGGPSSVMAVDWNQKNRKEVIALGMGIGALTKDDGKTWSTFPVPMGSSAIAISATGSTIFVAVLIGDQAEILSSANNGKNWI